MDGCALSLAVPFGRDGGGDRRRHRQAAARGATRKSEDLATWLETVLHLYGDRVLAFDTPTVQIAGALSDRTRGQVHALGLADIIIAATAQHHGLTIMSRNVRHFVPLGVLLLDPFDRLPPA
jgi:toxin FitB